jgi:hypothetical protein
MNVLPFARSRFPERCQRYGLGGQADRGHGAKLEAAWYDRILSIESKFASAVRGCETDIRQQLIDSTVKIELG